MPDFQLPNDTHFSSLIRAKRVDFNNQDRPTSPLDGEFYFDNNTNQFWVYNAARSQWFFANFTTTTSTSTSTTTTSTSTTTTSTSTSTTTSTSTSTSTSTTTTL